MQPTVLPAVSQSCSAFDLRHILFNSTTGQIDQQAIEATAAAIIDTDGSKRTFQ
jgi:hypothetical protein